MARSLPGALNNRRILIVEDDYMIASDLARSLELIGAVALGPVGTIADALALVRGQPAPEAAVLDINLGAEKVFPVADALQELGVPFVFATGYDSWIIPAAYTNVPLCEKPVDMRALARALSK